MCHTPYFLTKYDTPFVSPQTAVKKDNYVDGIAQTTTHNGDSSTVGVGHVTLTRQLVHCSLLEVFWAIRDQVQLHVDDKFSTNKLNRSIQTGAGNRIKSRTIY